MMDAAQELPQGWSTLPPGWSATPPASKEPPKPPPDPRNKFQRAVDRAAQPEPLEPGMAKWPQTVASGMVRDVLQPIAHPLQTLDSMSSAFHGGGALDATTDFPGKATYEEGKQIGYGPAILRTLAGLGAGVGVGAGAGEATSALRNLASAVRPSPSPSIVPPIEMQAQRVAQSVLPPGGIKPEFLKSIQEELPAVKAYAARTNNPMRTQIEGMKASQGVAQEGLAHYQGIRDAVADTPVQLGVGKSELGPKSTLGQVDARITKLNHMLDTAKASSEGQTLDVLAKSGLTDELHYLRAALYKNMSEATGIPVEQLRTLREGYGGEFSLANQIEAAKNARLTRTGQRAQGQMNIPSPPLTTWELLHKAYRLLQGGEQAIADRQFSRAVRPFDAQEPVRPQLNAPPPPVPATRLPIRGESTPVPTFGSEDVGQRVRSAITNRNTARNAAQEAAASEKITRAEENRTRALQEFTHARDLEASAQEAAKAREQRVKGFRESRDKLAVSRAKLEAEAARTIGRDNARKMTDRQLQAYAARQGTR